MRVYGPTSAEGSRYAAMPDGVQHVEQVLADPGVDVAQRAPEDGVQPVVAAPPAGGHQRLRGASPASAAGVRSRIQATEPSKIVGASLSRVATW